MRFEKWALLDLFSHIIVCCGWGVGSHAVESQILCVSYATHEVTRFSSSDSCIVYCFFFLFLCVCLFGFFCIFHFSKLVTVGLELGHSFCQIH